MVRGVMAPSGRVAAGIPHATRGGTIPESPTASGFQWASWSGWKHVDRLPAA
jgi:hypothetical protein